MRPITRSIFCGTLAWLAACTDAVPSEPVVSPRDERAGLQTAELSVSLSRGAMGWEGRIPYTIRNVSSAPLHITNCNGSYGVTLERWDDGRWVLAWGNVVLLCLSGDIVIRPGESLAQELWFFAAFDPARAQPAFEAPPPPSATYRLRIAAQLARAGDRDRWPEAPLVQVTSNPFTLRLP